MSESYDDYGGWGDAPDDDQPETVLGTLLGDAGEIAEDIIESVLDIGHDVAAGAESPFPVRVVNPPGTAPFGATSGYALIPGQAVQILRRRPNRYKARVWVFPSAAGQTVTDGIMIGTAAQCEQVNTSPPNQPYWPIGQHVEIDNQREWYALAFSSNSNIVYVSVLDETGSVS